MAYDDKDKTFFPTRYGVAIGSGRERVMLDKVGGAQTIATKIRENSDGTTTRLKTRAGFPEFITDGENKESESIRKTRYAYGLVDSYFSVSGSVPSTNSPLNNLINELGITTSSNKAILKDSAAWKNRLFGNLPTNFTGMMRRVAQVLFTQGKAGSSVGTKEPKIHAVDDFLSTSGISDGLLIASDGSRWVIEISADGIYRIPVTFAEELTPTWEADEATVFSSHSYEEAVDILTPRWIVTRFVRAEKVLIGDPPQFYSGGYGAWYSWCAWAFSYDGTKATNVGLRNDPLDASWRQAGLHDISISFSGSVPSYAVSVETEVARLATNVVDYGGDGTGVFQTADTYPGVLSTTSLHRAGSSGIDAPIFSYYTKDGEKKVFRYKNFALLPILDSIDNRSYEVVDLPVIGSRGAGGANEMGDSSTNCQLPADGIILQNKSGSSGGGYEFSGSNIVSGSGDFQHVVSDTVRTSGGVGGYVTYSGIHPMVYKYQNYNSSGAAVGGPYYIWPSLYVTEWGIQASSVVEESRASVDETRITKSCVVMDGYDRESIAFCGWQQNRIAPYTKTISNPNLGIAGDSVLIYLAEGLKDYKIGEYLGRTTQPDGGYTLRYIGGIHDYSGVSGKLIGGAIHSGPSVSSGIVSIYTGSVVVPEQKSETINLSVFIGSNNFTLVPKTSSLLNVYESGYVFLFRTGLSAFYGTRVFYSTDANAMPKVSGVGQFNMCQYTLNNFVGVF